MINNRALYVEQGITD